MSASLFLLSALGATLSIHVVEVKDLPLDQALSIAHALGDELAEVSGDRVVVSDQLWSQCEDEAACARELAQRDGASGVLLLHVFRTPHTLLLIADRRRSDGARVLTVSRRIEAKAEWRAEIASLAREVFVDRLQVATPVGAPAKLDNSGTPWFLIGSGSAGIFTTVGVAFALSSISARSDLLDGARGAEIDRLTSRMELHQTLMNICLAGAIASFAAGIVLEVLQ
jgi:hypothetical protein